MHKTPFGQVRGPRRLRRERTDLFLACPRVAPDWELAAIKALMKPQLRGAIEHRDASQVIPEDAPAAVESYCELFAREFDVELLPYFSPAGHHWMVINLAGMPKDLARALAAGLSKRLPTLWFVLDRLFVHDGKFFRRIQGYKLQLGPAHGVHLTRELRAKLKDINRLTQNRK